MYTFQALESKFILSDLYPNGRQLFYVLTPAIIVYAATSIRFTLLFLRKQIPKFSMIFSFFLTGILFIIISSMQAKHLRSLSFFYSTGFFFEIVLFLDAFNYLRAKNEKIKKFVLNTLLLQIAICIAFVTLIVILQFLKRDTIGIHIEAVDFAPIFGKGSDENPLQFRPVGLSTHANLLAKQILELFTAATSISLILLKTNKLVLKKSILKIMISLAITAIILTQSRSAYLALLPYAVVPLIYFRKETKKVVNGTLRFVAKNKLLTIIVFFVTSLLIPDRFLLSMSSLSEGGGLVVRNKLNELAMQLISANPFFGTGTGTFIPAAFEINYYGVMSYFPESVHNGLLLAATENGLLSLSFFYIGYYLLLRKIKKSKLSKYKYLIYAGFIGQLIIMMFQPFPILLPLNVLVLILITELTMI